MLDVRGLQVRYGSVLAVDNVALHVDAGEIVVLIGTNGAGKSSAVNTIAGLVQSAKGEISFTREDVCRLDPDRVDDARDSVRPEDGLPA